MTIATGAAIFLIIVGSIVAIVGNYNMWWGADSMIGEWGSIGLIGLAVVIAGSIKLNSSKYK